MSWATYLTVSDGHDALVLLDRQYERAAPREHAPRLATVTLWCRLPVRTGFWDPAEEEPLHQIESMLLRATDAHVRGWAVFVRNRMTAGRRDLYFYSAEHVDLAPVLATVRTSFPEYRLELAHETDPGWRHYAAWLAEPVTKLEEENQ